MLSDSGPDSGYVFPQGLILEQNAYLVICKNLKDFKTIHPDISNSVGNLPFGLSSSGDQIRLYDGERNIMDAVDYYPGTPWPTGADGTGSTLELIDPNVDNTQGANWKVSPPDGTPGKKNSWYLTDDIIETFADANQTSNFSVFPNPFRDFTTLTFSVDKEGVYQVQVVDMSGRVIRNMLDEHLYPDTYYLDWIGDDNTGAKVAPGVYSIRLIGEDTMKNSKIIKLK